MLKPLDKRIKRTSSELGKSMIWKKNAYEKRKVFGSYPKLPERAIEGLWDAVNFLLHSPGDREV